MAHRQNFFSYHPRILLTADEILRLPIKTITPDEVYKRRRRFSWNGWEWYPDGVLLPDELGYDDQGRYLPAVDVQPLKTKENETRALLLSVEAREDFPT